jgi:hypothetical protein
MAHSFLEPRSLFQGNETSVGPYTFGNATDDHADDAVYYPIAADVAMAMIRYLFPVVVFVGTIGNALSALVLVRQRMRTTSIYAYLLALAGADTLVLYVSAFKTWIRVISGVEWLHLSDAACRVLIYLFVVGLHLSAWLIVLVTLDRFIAVCLPLRAVQLCTVRRARLFIVGLIAFQLIANSHIFWTIRLQYRGGVGNADDDDDDGAKIQHQLTTTWSPLTESATSERSWITTAAATFTVSLARRQQPALLCAPIPDNPFANVTFNYIKCVTYSLLPFVVVVALNVGIIWRAVRVTPRLRRNFGGSVSRGGRESSEESAAAAGRRWTRVGGKEAVPIVPTVSQGCCGWHPIEAVPPLTIGSGQFTGALPLMSSSPNVGGAPCRKTFDGEGGVHKCDDDKRRNAAVSSASREDPPPIEELQATKPTAVGRRNSATIGSRPNKDGAAVAQVRQWRHGSGVARHKVTKCKRTYLSERQ